MDNFSLPRWIDPEAWAEFVDMRKRIKKPLTQRSAERQLLRLFKIKDAGHDPNASLVQSADHYWQDLYVPKVLEIEAKPRDGCAATREYLDMMEAERRQAMSPESHEAKRAALHAAQLEKRNGNASI